MARDADPRRVAEAERIRGALSTFRWPLRLHGLRVLDDTRESMATAYTRDRASALVILANAAYRASLALPSVEAERDRLAAELAAARAEAATARNDARAERETHSRSLRLAFQDGAIWAVGHRGAKGQEMIDASHTYATRTTTGAPHG